MQKIMVELPHQNYPIWINQGMLENIPKMISEIEAYHKVMIITDENVEKLYLNTLKEAFIKFDPEGVIKTYSMLPGETSKSFSELSLICSQLAKEHFTRRDLIIALGGGVVGDLAGFVAATYLRGIDFIQVPTTLLAQVDSSVGGKVAINIPEGKNLVGSFYQPKAVFIDVDVLETLPQREIISGMGEVIKYAYIKDEALLNTLKEISLETLSTHYTSIIKKCVLIKRDFVVKDEKETFERMHLNFGHTIGHAIEKASGFKISHGRAVGLGIYYMVKAQYLSNEIEETVLVALESLLNQYHFMMDEQFEIEALMSYIKRDKKTRDKDIQIIVLDAVGKSVIRNLPIDVFETYITEAIK